MKKNKMEQVEDMIKIQSKKLDLFKELGESLKYEQKTYEIVKLSNFPVSYCLYHIGEKRQLVCGPANRIKSYMNLRNIAPISVYNIELI
jgi:hypothetical protein